VRAAAALSSGDAAKAIELLKSASAYDKATTQALYIRGLAYWKAGLGNEAAQEFQKVLALHGASPSDPLMSFAHLGLAGRMRSRAIPKKATPPTRIFLPSGRMPTLMFRF